VDAGVDIVNFDAFQHGESVALYPDAMRKHLVERKRFLAWGIVPTGAAIREVDAARLVERFEKLTDHLAAKAGVDKGAIVEQSFVTPSCGTGSMAIPDAERVFGVLGETSRMLKGRYGF